MSDIRIDPSSTSTHLDYGENPDTSSRHQGSDSQNQDKEQKTYLEHNEPRPESKVRLKSRKTRKKRLEKKKRKLAERQARKSNNQNQNQ